MSTAARTQRARRSRQITRDHYRSYARVSGVSPRLPRPIVAIDAALLALAIVFILIATPRIGSALGSGVAEFGTSLADLFPSQQGSKPIELPTTGATVSTSLPLDFVPDFTKDSALKLTGKVPSFLLAPSQQIEISLNSAIVATLVPDATGAYSAALTLKEGPNAIALRLLTGTDSIATSSYTVIYQKTPPKLVVSKPKDGDKIEGTSVAVEGKADPGATIIVNDRIVVPGQDGAFTDSVSASPGPLTITVVARDRAGNETTTKTQVTVTGTTTQSPLTVTVTLDATKVKPGALVNAVITVTSSGAPKADEQVTLSVGVIAIGTGKTNANGSVVIGFFAPPNEGDASVVVLASGASGRATLTVAK